MLGGMGMEEVAAEAQAAAYDEFRSPFMELVLFRPETFDIRQVGFGEREGDYVMMAVMTVIT